MRDTWLYQRKCLTLAFRCSGPDLLLPIPWFVHLLLSQFDLFSQVAGSSLQILGLLHPAFGCLVQFCMRLMHALQMFTLFSAFALLV